MPLNISVLMLTLHLPVFVKVKVISRLPMKCDLSNTFHLWTNRIICTVQKKTLKYKVLYEFKYMSTS